jgi:hypothetical protein
LRHLNSIERLFCFPKANGKLAVPCSQLAAVFPLKGFDWLSFHVVREVLIDMSTRHKHFGRYRASLRVSVFIRTAYITGGSSTGPPPAAAGSQPARAHSGHAE